MENLIWSVRVNPIPASLSSEVYIYRFSHGRRDIEYITISSPDVCINRVAHEHGAVPKITPTFVCDTGEAMNIARAFIAYANEQGFKNGDETFAKGKLEATESHLADMRQLLKLK